MNSKLAYHPAAVVDDSPSFTRRVRKSDYRRIADGLRHQILSGSLPVGAQLPATPKLATTWKTSYGTIHNALQALVKEGWLDRVHGTGTYVAESKTRFSCAGIFHSFDIGSTEQSGAAYARSIQAALVNRLSAVGKEAQIFLDHRTDDEKGTVLPALADAILHRRIQCVIAPTPSEADTPVLARLPVPTAFLENNYSSNRADFSKSKLNQEGLRILAAQGCRSAGLITNIDSNSDGFEQGIRDTGLVTSDAWIRRPDHYSSEFAAFGYQEFHRLWQLPEKPDGLIVFPDVVAAGVVTAILEIGLHVVTPRMKFIFHRNSHLGFLCPFPVTWALSDEKILAQALIEQIEKQFAGEKASPILLPYEFKENETWIVKP